MEEEARLEEEKKLQEARVERERQREEERVRFQQMIEILNQELLLKAESLEKWKSENWKAVKWDHYVSCDSIPNPSKEKAMNTYLTLSEEGKSCTSMKAALSNIKEWLELVDRIQQILSADGLPEPNTANADRYRQNLGRLQVLMMKCLDQVTLHYMGEADKHVDTETFNLLVEGGLDRKVKYGLWGNVVKDPRLKSFSFKEHFELTLEIPKPLLLADIAIRFIQVDFDPLSPQSPSYSCPPMTTRSNLSTAMSAISGSVMLDGDLDAPLPTEPSGGEGLLEVERSGMGSRTVCESSAVNMLEESERAISTTSQILRASEDADDAVGTMPSAITALSRTEEGAPMDISVTLSNPKGGVAALEEDEIDLRGFRPAVGPIFLQALELPPQPKSVNHWVVKRVLPDHPPEYVYPSVMPRPPPSAPGEEASVVQAPLPGSALWQSISITFKLPTPYIYPEEPQMARWDETEKLWRTKGLLNPQFDMTEETVSFQTYYFCPFAVMVDQYANMPYASWQLLPKGKDHTLLIIEGGIAQITVEIKGEKSTLVGPDPTDQPSLSHLLNQPMSAKQLIAALKSVGANFFPEPDAARYVSVTKKRYLIEVAVYRSMALASCAYGFQWSHWNGEVSPGNIILQVAEKNEKGVDEMVWRNYVGGRKSFRLQIKDDSDMLSLEKEEAFMYHPDLYIALQQEAPPEIVEAMKETSPIHYEAVQYWLNSTKIATFS